MFELAVAAARSDYVPAILLERFNEVSNFHRLFPKFEYKKSDRALEGRSPLTLIFEARLSYENSSQLFLNVAFPTPATLSLKNLNLYFWKRKIRILKT